MFILARQSIVLHVRVCLTSLAARSCCLYLSLSLSLGNTRKIQGTLDQHIDTPHNLRMRFYFTAVATLVAKSWVEARRGSTPHLFGVDNSALFGKTKTVATSSDSSGIWRGDSPLATRGGDAAEAGEVPAPSEEQPLYLPGLLQAAVDTKNDIVRASSDYTITVASAKARELGVKAGDIVGVVGRRRRASYARVAVAKMSREGVRLSHNLGNNLRLTDTDKAKVVLLTEEEDNDGEEGGTAYRTGDVALLACRPAVAAAVTFSPVQDSLDSLERREGGDELSEEELRERFVTPYLNFEESDELIVKVGHTLVLTDDNGNSLEFTVSHLDMSDDLDASEEGDEEKDAEEGAKSHGEADALLVN